MKKGIYSEIKKINETTGQIVSGRDLKISFSLKEFYLAVKYLIKTFNLKEDQAISQLKYYLINNARYTSNTKRTNTIALSNIYNLEYKWDELFNY